MKTLTLLTFFSLSLFLFGFTQPAPDKPKGKDLYLQKCIKCHGTDGTKGLFGAKNLQKSTLTDEAYFTTISNGRRIMPAWKKKLTTEQILSLIHYIKQLRQ